jgi:hypothetical protein
MVAKIRAFPGRGSAPTQTQNSADLQSDKFRSHYRPRTGANITTLSTLKVCLSLETVAEGG